MIAHRNSLAELAQFGGVQFFSELGLSHEHNLKQLFVFSLEIGQHADLFQEPQTQVLRLVDNHHHIVIERELFNQKAVEIRKKPAPCFLVRFDPQVLDDRLQKLEFAQTRIENKR